MPGNSRVPSGKQKSVSESGPKKRLFVAALLVFLALQSQYPFHKNAHPIEIYIGKTMRDMERTVAPAGYEVRLHIDAGEELTQTAFAVEVKDTDGFLVSSGVGFRRERLVEIQLPAFQKAGDYVIQVFEGKKQVSESILKVEDEHTRVGLKGMARLLLRLIGNAKT